MTEATMKNMGFLHDRPWISPWIKSISNELYITCHVFASQLSGHCDVIANRLWRHQQNVKRARHGTGIMLLILALFMDPLCRVRNKIMYVLLRRTVYAFTRVLFWCLFPPPKNKNKITLSWAHKQFATRVHKLFSINYHIHPELKRTKKSFCMSIGWSSCPSDTITPNSWQIEYRANVVNRHDKQWHNRSMNKRMDLLEEMMHWLTRRHYRMGRTRRGMCSNHHILCSKQIHVPPCLY